MKREIALKNEYGKILFIVMFSWLLAAGTIVGKISPLSIAFIGCLSGIDAVAAFLGASVSLLIRGDFTEIVPFIISAAVITAVKLILGKSNNFLVVLSCSLLCGASVLLTDILTLQESSELMWDFILAAVCCVSCYSLTMIQKKINKGFDFNLFNPVKAIPYAITFSFLIASLCSMGVGIFNFGLILSSAAILLASYRNRFGGAGTVGVLCAIGISISLDSMSYAGVILIAGGITAAALSPKGRLPLTASFIFISAIVGAMLGMDKDILAFMGNIIVGSVIFMALPYKRIRENMGRRSSYFLKEANASDVFAGRLELVGDTISELRLAVEKTAETLDYGIGSDISKVYNSACDIVCKNCRYNIKCWGDEYNDSARTMSSIIGKLKTGETVTADSFTGAIAGRCPKKQMLCDNIIKKYDDYLYSSQMNRRVKEMRGILTKQLENTEKLFNSMAAEFEKNVTYDKTASHDTEILLERCGISNPRAVVKIADGFVRMEAYGKGKLSCAAEEFGDLLSQTIKRDFDLPTVLCFGDKVRITAFERAEYGVKFASVQLSRNKNELNGDYVSTLIDGKGYYYSILSDGMGNGTRARIDSAFVCGLLSKLLESGVEPETAIDMLNTSLLVKSSDESFATLDLCKVDLYTGNTTIYKAGGADSYIKSGNSITRIKGKGLPVGVCENISLSSHSFTAGENDVIIMTSDGAELSEQWLEQAFTRESGSNIDELVKTIAGAARFNSEKGREDDISIVALKIKK